MLSLTHVHGIVSGILATQTTALHNPQAMEAKHVTQPPRIPDNRQGDEPTPNSGWISAAFGSILAHRVTLIHGQPGTGKTFLALRLTASILADCNAPVLYLSDAGTGYTQHAIESMNVLPMAQVTRQDADAPDSIPLARERLSIALVDVDFHRVDHFIENMGRLLPSSPILRKYRFVTIDCGALSAKTTEALIRNWFRYGDEGLAPGLLIVCEVTSSTQQDSERLAKFADCILNVGCQQEHGYVVRTAEIQKSRFVPRFQGVHSFRIQDLFGLLHSFDPSRQIIDVVVALNAELIAYLKTHPTDLYAIHPRRFEELIAEILASFGWRVGLTAETRDGGYDIFAISSDHHTTNESSWLVECKRWSPERKVGIEVVRGLYGVRELNSVFREANIMIATTSDFSCEVQQCHASRYDLDLHNYSSIMRWINDYHPSYDGGLHLRDRSIVVP